MPLPPPPPKATYKRLAGAACTLFYYLKDLDPKLLSDSKLTGTNRYGFQPNPSGPSYAFQEFCTDASYSNRVRIIIDWSGDNPEPVRAEITSGGGSYSGKKSSTRALNLDPEFLRDLLAEALRAPVPDQPLVSLGWRVRGAIAPGLLQKYPVLPLVDPIEAPAAAPVAAPESIDF